MKRAGCHFRLIGPCLVFGIARMLFSCPALGQVETPEQQTPEQAPPKEKEKPPSVERVAKGIYRVDNVLLDRNRNLISFPAVSNQVNGLVEYGIVHENGKTHEALFRTKARPIRLQFVLLLAKMKPAKGFVENLWEEKPKPMDVTAHKIGVFVSWDHNGSKGNVALETLALNQKDAKPIEPNSFVFNGSRFVGDSFQAESSGSILAVYADDTAMFNSSDYDSNNDDVWYADKNAMPPLETPVIITLRLPKAEDKRKPALTP